MGTYFPWKAAAWSFAVVVTWPQPYLVSVNLLAPQSNPFFLHFKVIPTLLLGHQLELSELIKKQKNGG